MKAYLIGDTYWIQPIQLDRFSEFLNSPENIIKGSKITGVMADIDFSSWTTLPKARPKELPANPNR